jgi:hypothetical protein
MAGSCSERERAQQNSNLDVATQKAFRGKGENHFGRTRFMPNFCQSAFGAVRRRRRGHEKYSQSYQ